MKKNMVDVKDDFVALINRQKKVSAIALGAIVLCIIGLIILVPKAQANIRASQIHFFIDKENLNKKVSILEYQKADKEIADKRAVTVLFSAPHGKEYDKVMKVFKDTTLMNTFNLSLYIYPIVYNSTQVEEKYKINKNNVTVVFFENGKEKNRVDVDSSMDVKTMLIPALNQLPLSAAQESIQPAPEATKESTTATSSTTAETQVPEQPIEETQLSEQPIGVEDVGQVVEPE